MTCKFGLNSLMLLTRTVKNVYLHFTHWKIYMKDLVVALHHHHHQAD